MSQAGWLRGGGNQHPHLWQNKGNLFSGAKRDFVQNLTVTSPTEMFYK